MASDSAFAAPTRHAFPDQASGAPSSPVARHFIGRRARRRPPPQKRLLRVLSCRGVSTPLSARSAAPPPYSRKRIGAGPLSPNQKIGSPRCLGTSSKYFDQNRKQASPALQTKRPMTGKATRQEARTAPLLSMRQTQRRPHAKDNCPATHPGSATRRSVDRQHFGARD